MDNRKKMTNCPKCQRPILNEGIFTSHAKFKMKCPWCLATLEVNVQPRIITEVVKLANGDTIGLGNKSKEVIQPNTLGSTRNNSEKIKVSGYLFREEGNENI